MTPEQTPPEETEQIQRECARVAAALELAQWQRQRLSPLASCLFYKGNNSHSGFNARFAIASSDECLLGFNVFLNENAHPIWGIHRQECIWLPLATNTRECSAKMCEYIARSLYRLDIEEDAVLSALNHPLSMHEKLELRQQFPREFWPSHWQTPILTTDERR